MSGFDDVNFTTVTAVASYTVLSTDYIIFADATAGAQNITLPAASTALKGRTYVVAQSSSTANANTIKTAGGTINGAAAGTGVALTASKYGVVTCVCDGTNWFAGGGSLVLS